MLRKLLVSLVFLSAVPAMAQICAPSNAVGLDGIGDGCSTRGAEYVFPGVGIFKSTFTPSCDAHDKCYTQLGASYGACDSAFYEDMRNRCDDKYNKFLRPAEWSACRTTAFEYYTAVKQWGSTASTQYNMQTNARNRSILQQYNLDTDTCGTTPERTTLYAPALIAQINNAWLGYAGRLPTVYEFVTAANSGDIVNDRAGWNGLLYTLASQAAAVQPPLVGWTRTSSPGNTEHTLTANPIQAGVAYRWRTSFGSGDGPSTYIWFEEPMYNATFQVKGYLKATSPAGVRNLALVEFHVPVRGWCGSRGGQCQ
jgi:hypothetical protein